MPGVIRWPGRVRPGSESAEPIVFYDILPTLFSAAGVAPLAGVVLDGVDVLPILEGRSA